METSLRLGVVTPDFNPCKGVERFKERPRSRYVDDIEYSAFKNFAGVFLAAYMDVKVLTGLRQGDVLALRLDQIMNDGIHILVQKIMPAASYHRHQIGEAFVVEVVAAIRRG